jgi:hypothetical protein
MQKHGPPTPVQVVPAFVESPTSYRAWIGDVVSGPYGRSVYSPPYVGPPSFLFTVIRRPDGLSSRLRGALAKARPASPFYKHVLIQTPSLALIKLSSVTLNSVGPAMWIDFTHPKPDGKLEGVTYTCSGVEVNGVAVGSLLIWWPYNTPAKAPR